jgi:hypothetical protein
MAQVLARLPMKHKALSSNPSTANKKKKESTKSQSDCYTFLFTIWSPAAWAVLDRKKLEPGKKPLLLFLAEVKLHSHSFSFLTTGN